MTNPYRSQPSRAFWRRTISGLPPLDVGDWYQKRFSLDGAKVATAGSCFAQHIGRRLREFGFDYLDAEPPPALLPPEDHQAWGYGVFSGRYGNIYTTRQFTQLIRRAAGTFTPAEDWWVKGDGVADPFRPNLEPEPFGSVAEMRAARRDHLDRVATLFRDADVFVFTLGLTEAWLSKVDGAVYPLCPGTTAGTFDSTRHAFANFTVAEVRDDLVEAIAALRAINPGLRVLLTVSPVPLMATATEAQVAVATAYSKAVLRAVAGELYQAYDFVDYFPSFEIVTSRFMPQDFFAPDRREVTEKAVDHVMSFFFAEHRPKAGAESLDVKTRRRQKALLDEADNRQKVLCDEEMLDAFSGDADE